MREGERERGNREREREERGGDRMDGERGERRERREGEIEREGDLTTLTVKKRLTNHNYKVAKNSTR